MDSYFPTTNKHENTGQISNQCIFPNVQDYHFIYFLMYRITTLYELTVVCTVIHKFSKFNYSAYLLYTRHVELLMRLSLTCLLRSSNKSFMAVTPSTNSTGIIAISFPNALIAGTQFNNTIQIKYKFATRWNCSKRFFGRNDKKVYLVVRIRLSG